MKVIATIPLKRHLRLFVDRLENLDQTDGILDICEGGVVAYHLSLLLTTKSITFEQRGNLPEHYNDELKVLINARKVKFGQIFLTDLGVMVFNRFLHRLFQDMLLQFVLQEKRRKQDEKDAILSFLSMYGIGEDDYSFEAAKKTVFRLKKSRKIPTKTVIA